MLLNSRNISLTLKRKDNTMEGIISQQQSEVNEQGEKPPSLPAGMQEYYCFLQAFIELLTQCENQALVKEVQRLMFIALTRTQRVQIGSTLMNQIADIYAADRPTSLISPYHIAKDCKTHLVKIIWGILDCHLLVMADGTLPSSRQRVMEEFGHFLNDDLSTYSTLLSRSKAQDSEVAFMKPIQQMEKRLHDYYLDK